MKNWHLRRDAREPGRAHPALEINFSDLGEWVATAPQIRDTLLSKRVAAMSTTGFPEADVRAPLPSEVELVGTMAYEAVTQGCLIDFGFLPNDLIKDGAKRGGPLYQNDALPLPFRRPWVLVHSWDGGSSGGAATAVYLVNPIEPEKPAGDIEICELQPFLTSGMRTLLVGDRVWLHCQPNADKDTGYNATAAPGIWRYLPYAEKVNGGRKPEHAAAGNLLDPVMTCLLMFHAKGAVETRTIAAPEKVNAARVKNHKPPIPPYLEVDGRLYVTLLMDRRVRKARGEPLGGTHASPVPHIRTAHTRDYPSGAKSFIADTLVNVEESARASFKSSRSHYSLKRET